MTRHWTRPTATESARMIEQAREWTGKEAEPDQIDDTTWTLGDLKAAARVANARVRISRDSLRDDPVRLAESAIGYAIAVNPAISWPDAVATGQREIWDTATRVREEAGLNSAGDQKPRQLAYWLDELLNYQRLPPPTRCEARMTLAAVFADLPERHLDTLLILAFTDSMEDAIHAAGVKPGTWRQRVRVARECALALWFDTETPPPLSRLPINRRDRDRTCPQGHEISGDNIQIERVSGRVIERCKTCRNAQRAATKARRKEPSCR